ncbi:ATP-dependent RNA helicase, partial [Candidatus Parcubacteria bacterium]
MSVREQLLRIKKMREKAARKEQDNKKEKQDKEIQEQRALAEKKITSKAPAEDARQSGYKDSAIARDKKIDNGEDNVVKSDQLTNINKIKQVTNKKPTKIQGNGAFLRNGEKEINNEQQELKEMIERQDLPVKKRLAELVELIKKVSKNNDGFVVLEAETGSGKSVYSPIAAFKALKELGSPERVVMMQPRRDAATSIARAVSAVMEAESGVVGYSTSEGKTIDRKSAIAVVTSGIMRRYLLQGDISRDNVGAIILDEIHEGSIEYHLVFGLIKKLREAGQAPLVILTSATMDIRRLQDFFGIKNDNYLHIEGRAYPVEKHFNAHPSENKHGYINDVAEKVLELHKTNKDGDILVFLPGAKEINQVISYLHNLNDAEVLPLYGALSSDERKKALHGKKEAGKKRRIIVATDIAETSLTVPGITMVVDSCRRRSVRYNPKTGIIERGTEFVSKDSAEQRAGRAGRVRPGDCYRIITKEEYVRMPEFRESEIKRVNLAHTVLQLKKIGVEIEDFPFIEPPSSNAVEEAIKELKMLGALNDEGRITDLGIEMERLSFEPRLAKMVIEARKRNAMEAALVLVGFSRERDVLLDPSKKEIEEAPGFSPADKRTNARNTISNKLRSEFGGSSDIQMRLNIFAAAIENGLFAAAKLSKQRGFKEKELAKKFEKWCRAHHLKANTLRHIGYKLRDYAKYSNFNLDKSKLAERLRNVRPEILSELALTVYPDRLIFALHNSRGMPEFRRLSEYDPLGRIININPGSVLRNQSNFDVLVAFGGFSEGSGTRRGREITRIYAQDLHPIEYKTIKKIMPDILDRKYENVSYNTELDEVVGDIQVVLKGNSDIVFEDQYDAVLDNEVAVRTFASVLASGEIDLPWARENIRTIDKLRSLARRSMGIGIVKTIDSLKNWYIEKLDGAHNLRQIQDKIGNLKINFTDFCSKELAEEIDKHYPE